MGAFRANKEQPVFIGVFRVAGGAVRKLVHGRRPYQIGVSVNTFGGTAPWPTGLSCSQ